MILKRSGYLILIFCIFIQSAFAQSQYDPAKLYSPDTLKSDFRFLRKKLEKVHPALYRYTSKPEFDIFFDSLYQTLNKPLSEQQFLSLVLLLNQKIKDGHTMFLPGKEAMEYNNTRGRFFPFSIAWIDERLYTTENNSSDSAIRPGEEIISINGVSTKVLMSQLINRQIRDGYSQGYPIWILEYYFASYYSFSLGQPDIFILELKTDQGQLLTKTITALTKSGIRDFRKERYRGNKGIGIGIHLKPADRESAALLKIETFNPDFLEADDQPDYKKTMDEIFIKLRHDSVRNLILDLRNNQGGDFEPARVLISYLIENPCQFLVDGEESRLIQPNRNHFTGRIFLLMNGGSFSATAIVISTLQRDHRVILVGEETAGNKHIISGDPETFILPSTHMQCFISTKNYKILTGVNDGHGVLPDYYVHRTIGDLLSGIDAPMLLSLTIKPHIRYSK